MTRLVEISPTLHAAMEALGIPISLNLLNDFSLRTDPIVITVMFENGLFKQPTDLSPHWNSCLVLNREE